MPYFAFLGLVENFVEILTQLELNLLNCPLSKLQGQPAALHFMHPRLFIRRQQTSLSFNFECKGCCIAVGKVSGN